MFDVYFDDIVCIYERVFDEVKDDYIYEYYNFQACG